MATALLAYAAIINAVTFGVFALDKRKAIRGAWRIKEITLLGLCLAGGSLGGLLAMHTVRHKTQKWYFKYGVPTLLALNLLVAFLILRSTASLL